MDDGTGSAAVLAHGAGSAPRFVRAALGPALALAGVTRVEAPRDLTGDVDAVVDGIRAAVRSLRAAGRRVAFVGGVSLGAHAAARWAAGPDVPEDLDGLLLLLPAWTGSPDAVAAATAAAGDEIAAAGAAAVLARLHEDPALRGDWVLDQLAADWPGYPPGRLASSLRRAAGCPGPTDAELAGLPVPAGLVALADDPLHPAEVAQRWAALVPRAAVETVGRREPDAGLDVLGRAALAAWRAAAAQPTGPAD